MGSIKNLHCGKLYTVEINRIKCNLFIGARVAPSTGKAVRLSSPKSGWSASAEPFGSELRAELLSVEALPLSLALLAG